MYKVSSYLDTTKLNIFPRFIKVLIDSQTIWQFKNKAENTNFEKEVSSPVLIGLADECVQENLQPY